MGLKDRLEDAAGRVPTGRPATARRELSVREARSRFSEVLDRAIEDDEITYVMRHGQRVAAVVPLDFVEERSTLSAVAHWRQRLLEEVNLDELAELDRPTQLARLEKVTSHIITREGPVMSAREREMLVRLVVDESLGTGTPRLKDAVRAERADQHRLGSGREAHGVTARVLLGMSDRDEASALGAQIRELTDVEFLGVETSSSDVIKAVSADDRSDVVLVHQDLGPLPALELIRELVTRHPRLAVVLIAKEATTEIFSEAMMVGARGVVSDEPTLSELQSRISSAADWSRTVRRHLDPSGTSSLPGLVGTLLALCGAKGGTGTTTLAVQLAVTVALAKRKVCLVDMDLQKGDVSAYLDIHHRRTIVDLVGAADDLDGNTLAEALAVHRTGLHVLLAPADGEQGDDIPAQATRRILGALRSRYDVVIVDCGTHMAAGNATAVELADKVLVTTTPDIPCLRAAKRLVTLWGRLRIRKEDDLAIALTRHDRKNEVQPDFARKVLGLPLLRTTIPAAFRALEQAANIGSPTAVDSGDFRKAIDRITREAGLLDDGSADNAHAT